MTEQPPALSTRPLEPERYDACLELMRRETASYLDAALTLMGSNWSEFAQLFRTMGHLYAIFEGEVRAGFYWIEERGRVLHLHGLILEDHAQGRGIGREILGSLSRSYEGKVDAIELGVHESNTSARKLYDSCGFRVVKNLPELGFMVMRKPIPSGSSFDAWAPAYDRTVAGPSQFPLIGYEEVLEATLRLAQPAPGMAVLDLGVGTGNLAGRFLALGCETWGIDSSEAMLAEARHKFPDLRLVHTGLLDEWPAALRRSFDLVVSTYALHHLSLADKLSLLDRLLRRTCGEQGRIVIGDVSFPSTRAREEACLFFAESWDPDEYYWAADETIAAAEPWGIAATYEQVSSCGGVYRFRIFPDRP